MELVYLWVEEYKNIKSQGFNFSPRFECKYDKDKNELTINENKNYKSIFPENINITAIVGENGSGKSSLLEYINDLSSEDSKGLIVYKKDSRYFCFYENNKPKLLKAENLNIELVSNIEYKYKINEQSYLNFHAINIASLKKRSFHKENNLDFINLDGKPLPFSRSVNTMGYKYSMNDNLFFVPRYIHNIINNKNIIDNISSFFRFDYLRLTLKPSSSSVLKKYNVEISMPTDIYNDSFINNTLSIRNKIINAFLDIEKLHKKQFTENQKIDFGCFDLSLLIAFLEFFLINTKNIGTNLNLYQNMNEKLLKLLNHQKKEIEDGLNKHDKASDYFIDKWHDSKGYISSFFQGLNQIEELKEYFKDTSFSIDHIIEVLNFYYEKLIKDENSFLTNQYFDVPINNKLKGNINKINFFQKWFNNKNMINLFLKENLQLFEFDLYDSSRKILYDEISDGEKQLTQYTVDFVSIFNYYETRKDWNISIVCLADELDNHLHPRWKQKIIFNIIKTIKTYNKYAKRNIPLHLVLTTHSPFILSDLPKENVIFLDKVNDKTKEKYLQLNIDDIKNNNCINVSKYVDIKPFGANIHTLLSHGFFMSDGLMGEFAKGKIEEIKKFYELIIKLKDRIDNKPKIKNLAKNSYNRRKERFRHIESIIGEPFLQTVIKNYLDELEQIFDKESFKKKKVDSLISQFGGKDELKKYLDGI